MNNENNDAQEASHGAGFDYLWLPAYKNECKTNETAISVSTSKLDHQFSIDQAMAMRFGLEHSFYHHASSISPQNHQPAQLLITDHSNNSP